jgi:uncharacterized membrane-anchored protein YhcB (DUF1043 family)
MTWEFIAIAFLVGLCIVGLVAAILKIGRSSENKMYNNLYDGLDELYKKDLK